MSGIQELFTRIWSYFANLFTPHRSVGALRMAFIRCLAFAVFTGSSAFASSADNARLISSTIPATMDAGQIQRVTVTMRNSGTTIWSGGYAFASQETTWGSGYEPVLAKVPVATDYVFSFAIKAPSTPGTYNFSYQMVQALDAYQWFGPAVTATITVKPAAAASYSDAFAGKITVPTMMVAGQAYSASVDMANTGTLSWTTANGYRLGSQNPQDNTMWGVQRVELNRTIGTGDAETFKFTVKAPATPGIYPFQWQMLQEYVAWFGEKSLVQNITVVGKPKITFNSPQNGAVYTASGSAAAVNISASVTGSAAGLNTLSLYEGADYLWGTSSNAAAGISITKDFAVGKHTLKLVATDGLGQPGEESTTFEVVAAGKPTVKFNSPQNGAVYATAGSTAAVDISASAAAAAGLGLNTLSLYEGTSTIWSTSTNAAAGVSIKRDFAIGAHTLRLVATDGLGQSSETTTSFQITAAGKPTVKFNSPQNGVVYVTAGSTASVDVSASGAAAAGLGLNTLSLYEGTGTIWSTSTNAAAGVAITRDFAIGMHTLRAVATDGLSQSGEATTTFEVRSAVEVPPAPTPTTDKPIVLIMSPEFNEFIETSGSSALVTLYGSAAAIPPAQLKSMEFYVDGVKLPKQTGTAGEFIVQSNLALGKHSITLIAVDTQNRINSVSSDFYVIYARPEVTLSQPVNGSSRSITYGTSEVVAFSGTASAAPGATIVSMYLQNSANETIASSTSGSLSGSYSFPLGSHQLTLYATDSRGAYDSTVTTFKIVKSPPVVTLFTPTNNSSYNLTSGTTIDVAVSGGAAATYISGTITKFEIVDNGKVLTPSYTATSAALNTTIKLAPGAHRLQLKATDSFGSSTLSEVSNVTVSIPKPSAILTSPTDGTKYVTSSTVAPITFTGTGVAFTGFKVNLLEIVETVAGVEKIWASSTTSPLNVSKSLPLGIHTLRLRVTDSTTQSSLSEPVTVTVLQATAGKSAYFISQTMKTALRPGEPYTATVTMMNGGTTTWPAGGTYNLGSRNPQDNRLWNNTGRVKLALAVASGGTATFSVPISAPSKAGTYNFQWQMVNDTSDASTAGWFGEMTPNVQVLVAAGPGPTATLAVTPTNARVASGAAATLTFSGAGAEPGALVTKTELFKDGGAGAGYVTTGLSKTGSAATLAFTGSQSATAGVYWYMLRATDSAGIMTDSAPVLVNIMNSALLGQVTGVRIDANNKPQLVGWVCQKSSTAQLSYKVLLDTPSLSTGATLLTTGVANVSTELDNATVGTTCATPGVGHHFVVDLSVYSGQLSGRALYVQPSTAAGVVDQALPCADNTCTVPGSMRVNLVSPTNNSQYKGPATIGMVAQITGATPPYSEVAFSFDGGAWTAGTLDPAVPNQYVLNKTAVAIRATPYIVQARVRQGNSTVYSMQSSIIVGSTDVVNLLMSSPVNGATFSAGASIPLAVTVAGAPSLISTVQFYAGNNVIGAGTLSGSTWTGKWSTSVSGAYSLSAKAFKSDGTLLASSSAVNIVVGLGQGGTSSTPIEVGIEAPHKNNANAGTLPGTLGVSSGGAATYSIPLVVPPGTAGMAPTLSLDYSSDAPNSMLGLGWSLGGMSRISRCGRTVAQDGEYDQNGVSVKDGVNGRVSFDTGDRLCLDGKRLVLVNLPQTDSNYWADNAEYRTEIDDFTKITALGVGAARSFKAELKNGRVLTYGSGTGFVKAVLGTPNSGVSVPTPVAKNGAQAWALSRIADRTDNYVNFFYEQDATTGEHRPAVIRYGGAGLKSHAAIQLTYTARLDAWTRYLDETRNDLRSRIDHIKTYVALADNDLDGDVTAGSLVRDYALSYEMSPTSGRSMLNQVQVSARNQQTGTTELLPATTFEWGKPDPAKKAGFVNAGIWTGAPYITTWNNAVSKMHPEFFAFNDFESNGYTHVLEKRVAVPSQSPFDASNVNPVGKMKTSYRYFHNNGVKKNANGKEDGGSFTEYQYKLSTDEAFVVLDVGDFDGDGALDILVATALQAKICRSPFGNSDPLSEPKAPIVFTCDANQVALGSNTVTGTPYVIDVRGDGRSVHYGPRSSFNTGDVCLEKSVCVHLDEAPPVVGGSFLDDGTPEYSLMSYTSIQQVVDFTGIGKPYDVRWSKPRFSRFTYPDGSQSEGPEWQNLQPTISMYNFKVPGDVSDVGGMTAHRYIRHNPPGVNLARPPYIFQTPEQGAGLSGDFSGSGYTALAFGYVVLKYSDVGFSYASADMTLCQSTGRALDCGVRMKYSCVKDAICTEYAPVAAVGNFVGDGAPSILTKTMSYEGGIPKETGKLKMCRVYGDDTTGGTGTDDSNMVCSPWDGPESMRNVFFMDLMGTGRTQMMVYLAGQMNGNVWEEKGNWQVFNPVDVAKPNQALDRIFSVTNGVGDVSSVEYADGTAAGLVTLTAARLRTYPDHVVATTGKLVSRLIKGNGVASNRTTTYKYQDPAINVKGRGSLGFGAVVETDEQTLIVTTSNYGQIWPLTGMLRSSSQVRSGVTLSDTINTLAEKVIVQANGNNTKFVYNNVSKTCRRDLGNGGDLGCATTTNTHGDNYGNLTNQSVVQQLADNTGPKFTTETATTFKTCAANWLPGLPETVTMTKSDLIGGVTRTLTRTQAYDYACATGLLLSETVEPGKQPYQVKTTYGRSNGFGAVNTKTQAWYDPQSKSNVTRTAMDVVYDTNGRYPVTINTSTDATHKYTETVTYDAATGARKSAKDANGMSTAWDVDGFGRVTRTLRPDGNETYESIKKCPDGCSTGLGASVARITDSFHGGKRIAVPVVTYLDSVGHPLRTRTWGFDGRAINTDQEYDSMGRPSVTQRPYFDGEIKKYTASSQGYDELDRPTTTVTKDEQGAELSSTITYTGLTTVQINVNGNKRTEKRNVAGQLVEVIDDANRTTSFGYEPFQNLNRTTDPNGNVVSIEYDLQGRKTDLTDPDLGWIHYDVDPVGRVWQQTSAKQRAAAPAQSTTFQHDWLDRMIARIEIDLKSYWIFDRFDQKTKGIGKLAEAYTTVGGERDYTRTHGYDDAGRLKSTSQKLYDGEYMADVVYDDWGRVVQNIYYRTGDVPKQFDSRYNGNGYLARLERGNLVLWQINGQDAAQRQVELALGNGLSATRTFNPYSGRLTDGVISLTPAEIRLSENYNYDPMGNVLDRSQAWESGGLVENFRYDNLNRLKYSQAGAQTAYMYAYDEIGNLTTKGTSDKRTHVYPEKGANVKRPHGVVTVDGLPGTFVYDENGNMTGGAGRVIDWSSFNMPAKITQGSLYSTFRYGPEHQRTLQSRSDSVNVIYAGAQEVETKSGVRTVKTYWPYGVGVEIDRPNASATELNWVHDDRLGSPLAISDDKGNLREKLAYDAWGKRRMTDGSYTTPDSLDGVTDNRGFTGHEMLDQLNLVHMNGRVYDPTTARFISADPKIQDAGNGQSYNRYSYVWNNPTNFVDPSGFEGVTTVTISGAELRRQMMEEIRKGLEALKNLKQQYSQKVAPRLSQVGKAIFSIPKADPGSVELGKFIQNAFDYRPQRLVYTIAQLAIQAAADNATDAEKGEKNSEAVSDGTNSGTSTSDPKAPPQPGEIPTLDWNDPTKPPIGPNGEEWVWRGKPPQGGDKGGYVNPSNPDQSAHPDLAHPAPVGPHWDYTDRNKDNPGWRVYPGGKIDKK